MASYSICFSDLPFVKQKKTLNLIGDFGNQVLVIFKCLQLRQLPSTIL